MGLFEIFVPVKTCLLWQTASWDYKAFQECLIGKDGSLSCVT